MLRTPVDVQYIHGNEERLFRHCVPRLVKTLRAIQRADAAEVHYEGPSIEGTGHFHELSPNDKIVALHLACSWAMDRFNVHTNHLWVNATLECVYSWVHHMITQELIDGETAVQNYLVKSLQNHDDRDRAQTGVRRTSEQWLDLVNKLAGYTVFATDQQLRDYVGKGYDSPLTTTPEMVNMANRYFDDAMPQVAPHPAE